MTTATFTVTLSAVSASAVTVGYHTVDGTATAPANYTAESGTLTFAPGVLTQTVVVPLVPQANGAPAVGFTLALSNAVNATLAGASGSATIPAGGSAGANTTVYLNRFLTAYNYIKTQANGYFGPPTGPKAFQMPYHSRETLMAEAPDYGHESVSETISYWVKLEAWKIAMTGDTTGYAAAWASIEANYVPPTSFQPWGAYTPSAPATYTPDGLNPSNYPTLANSAVVAGADPLANALQTQYGTANLYSLHWLWDVDGVFGFHNMDGTTVAVAVNNYGRGRHEGLFDTVMHTACEDWDSGATDGGFLPIYQQGLPTYSAAAYPYAKQFSYTTAPDAEVRIIGSAWLAHKFAAAQSLSVATQDTKAKKLGDYLRYCLYDKYFRAIPGYDGTGAHNLISWFSAFGGQIPTGGVPSNFGFRIGSSSAHFGYNGVDTAYALATLGGPFVPLTSGAGAQWQASLSRQLEMLRWLQSPEGPIAGGVTNSWEGTYATPTDGRQNFKFYGMYYDYSPVYSEPPSNNWVGYQSWGLERVAALMLATATATDSFSIGIHQNCSVILNKFMPWLLANITVASGVITMPVTLNWVSNTQVSGQTTTTTNLDGNYEYLPNLNWDSSGNYSTFWADGAVPNVNLHCSITATGISVGIAASFSQLMIEYAQAHRTGGGALTDTIPNSSFTFMQCYTRAKDIMDALWTNYQDAYGFTSPETRADYIGFGKSTYLPPGYSGTMPNGNVLANGTTTFVSARSFLTTQPGWSQVAAYLAGGAAPVFEYHRTWEQTEVASGFAMLQQYFSDLLY